MTPAGLQMVNGVPPQPARLVATAVALRPFRAEDVVMAMELSQDPYIPLTGSLPAHADEEQALQWVLRQRGRLAEGVGYSFAIADPHTDQAQGQIGLWLRDLEEGRLSAGYSLVPSARGRGLAGAALQVVTSFAWTIAAAYRIELHIEPWNEGSIRTAECAGYQREGLLRSHQSIGDQRRDMLLYATTRSDT